MRDKGTDFFATLEELAGILSKLSQRGIKVYTSTLEPKSDGSYRERIDQVDPCDLESALSTQSILYVGQASAQYMPGCTLLAEDGLMVLECPKQSAVNADHLKLSRAAVDSGNARKAIERSGSDEPNRFDAVNASDAAYTAFVWELKAITVPALAVGYHVNYPNRRVDYPAIGVTKGAWECRGNTVFTQDHGTTIRFEILEAKT